MSKSFDLIKEDLKKVGIGLLIALGGAVVAFLGDLANIVDYSKYGVYAPYIALAVGSGSSAIINLIRKWISTTEY